MVSDEEFIRDPSPIWCPFTPKANQDTIGLVESTSEWLLARRVCPTWKAADWQATAGAWGTAYTMPLATGAYAETLTRYMSLGFALDDEQEQSGRSVHALESFIGMTSRLVNILEVPGAVTAEDGPYVCAFSDVARGFSALAPRSALTRLFNGFRDLMLGWIQESMLQTASIVPTVNDYFPFRYASGAAGAVASMVELSLMEEVPHDEMGSPLGRALTASALMVVLIDNEKLSRKKEQVAGVYDLSLSTVLHANRYCSRFDAPQVATEMRDRILAVFLTLRDRVHDEHSPRMGRYADALSLLIAGVVAFTPIAARYTVAGAPAQPAPTSERPRHATDECLPVPSVAWWWDAPAA
ncbi:terpene synthase family protein [Nocardia sp. CA-107356]|uniref:terpene synthase family protein n=1 Tax=Nocardia sp. CA-107356 TaxID=3239972 RepID=UPI003D93B575